MNDSLSNVLEVCSKCQTFKLKGAIIQSENQDCDHDFQTMVLSPTSQKPLPVEKPLVIIPKASEQPHFSKLEEDEAYIENCIAINEDSLQKLAKSKNDCIDAIESHFDKIRSLIEKRETELKNEIDRKYTERYEAIDEQLTKSKTHHSLIKETDKNCKEKLIQENGSDDRPKKIELLVKDTLAQSPEIFEIPVNLRISFDSDLNSIRAIDKIGIISITEIRSKKSLRKAKINIIMPKIKIRGDQDKNVLTIQYELGGVPFYEKSPKNSDDNKFNDDEKQLVDDVKIQLQYSPFSPEMSIDALWKNPKQEELTWREMKDRKNDLKASSTIKIDKEFEKIDTIKLRARVIYDKNNLKFEGEWSSPLTLPIDLKKSITVHYKDQSKIIEIPLYSPKIEDLRIKIKEKFEIKGDGDMMIVKGRNNSKEYSGFVDGTNALLNLQDHDFIVVYMIKYPYTIKVKTFDGKFKKQVLKKDETIDYHDIREKLVSRIHNPETDPPLDKNKPLIKKGNPDVIISDNKSLYHLFDGDEKWHIEFYK